MITNSIIYPLQLAPEHPVISCSAMFGGWFSISFKINHYYTHIHSPRPSEI